VDLFRRIARSLGEADGTVRAEDASDLSRRLATATAAGDFDGLRDIFEPSATIWNNFSGTTFGLDEFINMLTQMRTVIDKIWFEPGPVQVTADGFVDQHIVRCTTKKNIPVSIASCVVVRVRDGRIASLEEYANSADMAPLMVELSELSSSAGA
jgi:ketosteroid isomerase-like protein